MGLSKDLINQFVEATRPDKPVNTGTTVYGKTVEYNGKMYVQLDGSDLLTPVNTTTSLGSDERVSVTIQNHTATVTGNLSAPSASVKEIEVVSNKITELDIVVANKVSAEELSAERGRIDELVTENTVIKNTLTATNADIVNLQADNVVIKESLEANEAKFVKIEADIASIDAVSTKDLEAINADIHNLEATYAELEQVTAGNVEAVRVITDELAATDAAVEDLAAKMITTDNMDAKYANIDFANIGVAAIEKLFTESGIIKDLVVDNNHITGELVGVTIKGDLIEGGTVKADKLVVLGEDGLYYKLNTNGVTTSAEQTDYNSLNGSIITAKSITAEKIKVSDLVAFGATIGGFKIGTSSIYSGAKESVDNTTRGIYMDTDGQVNFGDSNQYLKYYEKEDGSYALEICADDVKIGSKKVSVETIVSDSLITSSANGSHILLTDSAEGNLVDIKAHGRSEQKQYVGRNLIPYPYYNTTMTKSGITFTDNGDGTITVNGTATATVDFLCQAYTSAAYTFTVPAGTYVMSGCPEGGSTSKYFQILGRVTDGSAKRVLTNINTQEITFTEDADIYCIIRIVSGATVSNITFRPMLINTNIIDEHFKSDWVRCETYSVGKNSITFTKSDDTSGNSYRYFDYYLEANKTYTVSANVASGDNTGGIIRASVYNNNTYTTMAESPVSTSSCSVTFTTPSDFTYIRLMFCLRNPAAAEGTEITFSEMTLKEDDITNTTYEPYVGGMASPNPEYPQEIKSVADGGTLDIKSIGKNLIPYPYTDTTITRNSVTYTDNGDGSITTNGTSDANSNFNIRSRITDNELWLDAGTYILSGCPSGGLSTTYRIWLGTVDIDTSLATYKCQDIGSGATFTLEERTKIAINISVASGVTVSNLTFKPMLRRAEIVDNTYELYKESIISVPLSEPLRSVCDVKDEIACVDGVYGVIRRISTKLFDGIAQGCTYVNSTSYAWKGITQLNLGSTAYWSDSADIEYSDMFMCDKFIPTYASISYIDKYKAFKVVNGNKVVACCVPNDLGITTNAEANEWLKNNNVTVHYILAEEVFEPFVDQTPFNSIATYNPITYITSTDNAEMDVTYYRNNSNGQNVANLDSKAMDAAHSALSTADSAQEIANDVQTKMVITEASIRKLEDSISMLVRDENGASLMTQTSDGWTFNISSVTEVMNENSELISELGDAVKAANGDITALQGVVTKLNSTSDYIRVVSYNNQPCIELGEAENTFRIRITNTAIEFVNGSSIMAYMSNDKLYIDKAEVLTEIQFGKFVWACRANGNFGLMWRGDE